jgi:hypothetical protein
MAHLYFHLQMLADLEMKIVRNLTIIGQVKLIIMGQVK